MKQNCVFVFKCRLRHPVINTNTHTHTLAKVCLMSKLIYSLPRKRGCAEVISVTPLCVVSLIRYAQHLNIYEGRVKTTFVCSRPVVSQWNRIMKKPISSFVKAYVEPCNQQILPKHPSEGKKGGFHFKEILELHSFLLPMIAIYSK